MTIQLPLKQKYLERKAFGPKKAGSQNSTPKKKSIAKHLAEAAKRKGF